MQSTEQYLSLAQGEMFYGRGTWGKIYHSGKDPGQDNMKMVNKIFEKWQQCVHKKDLPTICTDFIVRKTSYEIVQSFQRT